MDYESDKSIIKNIVIIVVVTILIIIFVVVSINFFNCTDSKDEIVETKTIKKKEQKTKSTEEIKKYIYVDLKGAVINPNVYKVEEGTRIIDLINIAGGLTEEADTSILNLSKELKDEMCIIIYTKYEVETYRTQMLSTKEINKQLEQSILSIDENNDAEISKNIVKSDNENKKISINNGTKEELLTISGIGESKANAIIKYREENGNFQNIEDIKNVSGIGESLYEKIKDSIEL